MMPRNTRATFTKVCEHCGITYERKRHANGCLENITQWKTRRACGPTCGNELRKKTYATRRAKLHAEYDHPPCTQCGKPVTKHPTEKYKRWRERKTCSHACRMNAMATANPKGNPSTLMRGSKPGRRKKLASDGYVFNGRFPTPATLKSAWQTVSGPDTGVHATLKRNGVTRSPRTMRMLANAFGQHPDLLAAFAGYLSDSWVQQDAASGR